MASYLFKIKKLDANERDSFCSTRLGNLKELCRAVLGCCPRFKNCYKSRRERGIEKARRLMEQEVNILDIVQSRRYILMALRHLLTNEKRQEFQTKSRFIFVDPSSDENPELNPVGD